MRAAQFDGIRGRVQVREMQIPEIDEEDALVRVVTCGICRSDWHLWNGDWEWFGAKLLQPAVLGHEIGGVVEKVGSSVRHIHPGMRVAISVPSRLRLLSILSEWRAEPLREPHRSDGYPWLRRMGTVHACAQRRFELCSSAGGRG